MPCFGDVAFVQARVHTMGEPGEAGWMVVKDGRVLAVGAGERTCEAARTVDLHGAVVLPGFIDAHAHPAEGGLELHMLQLGAVTTLDELAAAVGAWAAAHPEEPWIEGAGWDAVALDGIAPLAALDAATDRPVFLSSADGHSAFVNSAAFRLAGLDPATDPPGGLVDRGPDGPTGWIRETATDVVGEAVPRWSAERTDAATRAGLAGFAEHGVTSIVDANADADSLASYRRLDREGALTARVYAAVEVVPGDVRAGVAQARRLRARYTSPHLAVTGAKLYLDGVVESRTAALLAPYTDGTVAPLAFPDADLDRVVRAADRAGLQLHAHAIGDAAVRQYLDAIARHGAPLAHPPLAAHIELIDPADVPRFAELGVAADLQALWAYPDDYVRALTVPVVGPDRAARLYPFGELDRAGATLVAGSDWSVTTMNPWPAIEVALTRRDPAGGGEALGEGQALDLLTMLRAYTSEAGSVFPGGVGSLAPGAAADFVVLDRDPFAVPVTELSEVRVRETWMDGRRVYAAD